MSSKAQPVRAIFNVISYGPRPAITYSRAQSVRPSFGQRVFVGAAGQKIHTGNT